ncbi:MAG: cupin domain-containing protein [Chthoniobacterales bacterium]
MKKVNVRDLPEEERRSPKGKYHKFVTDISIALGREDKSHDLEKRHPFDLAQVRVPAGKSYCPYHVESAQWELYLVTSGRGVVRDASGTTDVETDDVFLFKPGEGHQLSAVGNEDFVYYVIADNPIGDTCYYPDSGKWFVRKEGNELQVVKGTAADYYDDEG